LHIATHVVLVSGMLSPPTAAEGGSILPLAPDIPLHCREVRAWMGDHVLWHRYKHGKCRGLGDAGGCNVHVAAQVFAARGAAQVAIIKIQFVLLPGEEQLLELVQS
jgi:hypothetical protein